jgi:hypothetical protein
MSGVPLAAVKPARRDPWRRLREKVGVTVKGVARRKPA